MKLRILMLLLSILLLPPALRGAGMSIGGATWVAWWDPSWSGQSTSSYLFSQRTEFEMKPGVLYGPAIAFSLPGNVSITSMFLYSRFEARIVDVWLYPSFMPIKQKQTITRLDSDSTIGYSITSFFQIFAGFKFQRYSFTDTGNMGTVVIKSEKQYDGYAPALGFTFIIALPKGFYIFFNNSVLYEFTTYLIDSAMYSLSSIVDYPGNKMEIGRIGLNSSISLAYRIPKIDTVITAGFRYQMLKPVFYNSRIKEWEYYDHFYGFTASASYHINFSRNKKE